MWVELTREHDLRAKLGATKAGLIQALGANVISPVFARVQPRTGAPWISSISPSRCSKRRLPTTRRMRERGRWLWAALLSRRYTRSSSRARSS